MPRLDAAQEPECASVPAVGYESRGDLSARTNRGHGPHPGADECQSDRHGGSGLAVDLGGSWSVTETRGYWLPHEDWTSRGSHRDRRALRRSWHAEAVRMV